MGTSAPPIWAPLQRRDTLVTWRPPNKTGVTSGLLGVQKPRSGHCSDLCEERPNDHLPQPVPRGQKEEVRGAACIWEEVGYRGLGTRLPAAGPEVALVQAGAAPAHL